MSTTIEPPERVTLATCIGCGARELLAPCTGDCVEVRLDLVDAGEAARLDAARAFASAARALLGGGAPADDAGWDATRARARALAHAAPDLAAEPPAAATTWWCASCGRIDAPQPCLGVCIRKPQEMVAAAPALAGAADLLAEARGLLRALRLLSTLRPRPGRHAETWAALAPPS
jgi:hypothetical protein